MCVCECACVLDKHSGQEQQTGCSIYFCPRDDSVVTRLASSPHNGVSLRQQLSKCSDFLEIGTKLDLKKYFCIKKEHVLYSNTIGPITNRLCWCCTPLAATRARLLRGKCHPPPFLFTHLSRRGSACSATTSCSASAGYKMEDVAVQSDGRSGGIVVKS